VARIALSALIILSLAGAAQACPSQFASQQAKNAYFAQRAARAHDVIVGQVVDLVAMPSPADASAVEGDATIAVLKVRKGRMNAGDRVVVPVDPKSRACGWTAPTRGATYELYLRLDPARGEYRVLESAASEPRPHP